MWVCAHSDRRAHWRTLEVIWEIKNIKWTKFYYLYSATVIIEFNIWAPNVGPYHKDYVLISNTFFYMYLYVC